MTYVLRSEEVKNTVKQENIDHLIEKSEIEAKTMFDKVTVVAIRLPNGFVLVESSGAVDKENYDFEIGKEMCIERIKDKLWELEGYVLQSEIN